MKASENSFLLSQLESIAEGLSETFAPFCEVVVHDLKTPEHAVISIRNNLSGRQPGDPATELGLARISSPDFPNILANYANKFSDGRPAKSTSIGIKNEAGEYVAALCLNVDMTLFRGMQNALAQFTSLSSNSVSENLESGGTEMIRQRIEQYAARLATTPRSLSVHDRKQLVAELKSSGLLEVRRAMETVSQHLGISRATAYLYARSDTTQ
ncbi:MULTISPECIES: helix-turn-helix transcriptional regulator [Klebsiella]|nr:MULTISPECIES: PAS domain-containing protein [Klebsiella]NRE88533.1 PAS domain-containing protein [Klebsiella michiganensis]AYZ19716.1 transcriptional regulator [Klebsiella sp. FDAARGOS_511]MBZ7660372.1 transcriptional regulator [Klebsiella grimontii]MCW9585655.1 PAS domain-containing protein [Klebsiella pasteurii]MDR6616451.1 putative transcriptional regulator YheO [Klebsiella sp. 1400]